MGRWIVKFNSTIETGSVPKPDIPVPRSRGTIVNEMVSNCQKHPPRTKNINDQVTIIGLDLITDMLQTYLLIAIFVINMVNIIFPSDQNVQQHCSG